MVPGEVVPASDEPIVINRDARKLKWVLPVTNTSDRPIQVGSHYHLAETNKFLLLDRALAHKKRLNILSGTAVRFEPGETKTVSVVEIAGEQLVAGGNNLALGAPTVEALLAQVHARGFLHRPLLPEHQPPNLASAEMQARLTVSVPRDHYAAMYGPTVGDRVRLGDTNLLVEVEHDFCASADCGGPGSELKFGGGKTVRDGQGQSACADAAAALDTVITNVLVLCPVSGIYKADIGIKNSLIHGVGKAGNPATMDGVDPRLIVGSTTEVISGEGMICTPGGVDSHVHFVCPQLLDEALASGITTMVGGGTGPATGTKATTCTPSPNHMRNMIQATDGFPMNIGLLGKGNCSSKEALRDIVAAGAVGLKLHEDWGTTPATIDACLALAEEEDVQVNIHTDTLNESSCCEQTLETFAGRTIHAYHCEGAGGGHAPDILTVCGNGSNNVLPSSTNPTRPVSLD